MDTSHVYPFRAVEAGLIPAEEDWQTLLAAIVENSDDAIIAKRLDGTITAWNRSAERLFGYRAEEIVGQNVTWLLPPDRLSEEKYIIERLRRGETIDHYQSQRVTKDRRYIDISLTVSPIRNRWGEVVGASKIIRDITSEKRAAAALLESESRFSQLANAMPEFIWRADPAGHINFYNQRWYDFTGFSSEEALANGPQNWEQIVHPDDLDRVTRHWNDSLSRQVSHSLECRLREAKSGAFRWFLCRAEPVRDKDGRLLNWFGISTNIDALKRIERERFESEARLKALMDAAADGILMVDEGGTILSANPAVERLFGYTAAESVGQPIGLFMPDAWRGPCLPGSYRVQETVGRRKSQALFPVELSISGWASEKSRVVTCIVRDVTERKRNEEKAKEQQATLAHLERNRTVGHMASGLAHELNQPLGAIMNYAAALKSVVGAEGQGQSCQLNAAAEILDDIIAQAGRAGEIIKRLRVFVKKQRPSTQARDLGELVRETLQMLSYDLRQAQLTPVVEYGENLSPIRADGVQIQQVLVNLIRNAIDAMEAVPAKDRRLAVKIRAWDGDNVRVDISDSGTGISPAIHGRIFDSFFTTKPQGLGIGLALCRTILEEHGGHLTAANNPDRGATFSFWLKAAPVEQPPDVEIVNPHATPTEKRS